LRIRLSNTCRWGFPMSRYKVLVGGLLMAGAGGYLIFADPQGLPLWFIWITGPVLWYLGIAVSIACVAILLFLHSSSTAEPGIQEKPEETKRNPVLHMHRFHSQTPPAGSIREIPAMGGFLL
jgi:hypothetical protein